MARSSYIYLVTEKDEPVAAFTVKWEMLSWIEHHPGDYEKWRMSDGLYGDRDDKFPVGMVDK